MDKLQNFFLLLIEEGEFIDLWKDDCNVNKSTQQLLFHQIWTFHKADVINNLYNWLSLPYHVSTLLAYTHEQNFFEIEARQHN